jgi:drug/metabolite transporter (DMT)-like permease
MPTVEQMAVLAVMSILAAVSQLLTMQAFRTVHAPVLAPFGYSEIVTATAVGFVLFGDFPEPIVWLGILVILASGIYIAVAGRPNRLPLLSRSRSPGA